eukprot:449695-Prymnesium_polylepis.1
MPAPIAAAAAVQRLRLQMQLQALGVLQLQRAVTPTSSFQLAVEDCRARAERERGTILENPRRLCDAHIASASRSMRSRRLAPASAACMNGSFNMLRMRQGGCGLHELFAFRSSAIGNGHLDKPRTKLGAGP